MSSQSRRDEMLDEARDYRNAGEARNSAVILQAITDELTSKLKALAEIWDGL